MNKKSIHSGHFNGPHRQCLSWVQLIAPFLIFSIACSSAWSGSLEQAKQIHDRIAGVPPTQATLVAMKDHIDAGNPRSAVELAMSHDGFYNTTLKNWVAPWTNREQTVFVPLNDYIATVIGIVRDGEDFRKVLYDDVIYVGRDVTPAYANNNNAHYEALESGNYSLQNVLERRSQSAVTGLVPATETAGVITTRAAARAFFKAGTNRAQLRFTLMNHLCRDLEQVSDITRVPDRIRQDVSRSPGGDSRVFLNGCIGCHSGMDPLAQAFAYFDYAYDSENDLSGENGQLVYNNEGQVNDTDVLTGTRVVPKYHINSTTFKYGFVTPNDRWDNYWRQGINAQLGWDTDLDGFGNGAQSMGKELAHSEAFAHCQVEKVFQAVCFREPENGADRAQISTMVGNFKADGYDIKTVFADSAIYCMGD